MIMRVLKDWAVFVGVLILTIVLASQALAFGARDVERVVGLLEYLADELGDIAYDEEAADDWYDEDNGYEARIAAAGYTRDSWRTALDRTVKGYFASMSEAEVEETFAAALGIEDLENFSEEQKQAMRELLDEMRAKLARWRAEGARDAELVRPYADRIERALTGRAED